MTGKTHYIHHRIDCAPLAWAGVAEAIAARRGSVAAAQGVLYGVWRSQIGQPRDTLNAITVWDSAEGAAASAKLFDGIAGICAHQMTAMAPTLRPLDATPPVRQGNFAFRWQETPAQNWPEFLDLCMQAWPGFESSYDSQVVGLWQVSEVLAAPAASSSGMIKSLLLTRRPDLAMWERSKIPQGATEEAVRAKLSRRYDLCASTYVYTTTLLTAEDRDDRARWT